MQGDDTWLTAEKEDATQRIEAPTASLLSEVVKLLNDAHVEGGPYGAK